MTEPDPLWDEQIEDRVINIEIQLSALGRRVVISLGASALALGGVVLTQFVLGKMTKGFMQYGEILGQHDSILRGEYPPQRTTEAPQRPDTGIDETRIVPKDAVVAEAAFGPESLVSDDTRRALESDPLLQARDLLIDDGLGDVVIPAVFDQDVRDYNG